MCVLTFLFLQIIVFFFEFTKKCLTIEVGRDQIRCVSRSQLFSCTIFRPRSGVGFCFRDILHLSQISLFGHPVSEPQLKQGNTFSLTFTDYYLPWLTEKNLIQIIDESRYNRNFLIWICHPLSVILLFDFFSVFFSA